MWGIVEPRIRLSSPPYPGKMLSIVIACSEGCRPFDSKMANGANETNVHISRWCLDEDEPDDGLEAIIASLPRGEAELARFLRTDAIGLNAGWQNTAGAAS